MKKSDSIQDAGAAPAPPADADRPARERILSAAFHAFMELGFAQASTLEIATRAKVSKRELYALFGSKQQMLISCISERARRMRLPADWPSPHTRADLEDGLGSFGLVMLREITDPDVVAVYRLAIGEAERSPEIARALQQHGRKTSHAALRAILEQAQSAGLLQGADLDAMVRTFLALLIDDLMMSLALGLSKRPSRTEMNQRASEATAAFLTLYAGNGVAG